MHFAVLFLSDGDGMHEEHAEKDRRSKFSNQAYVSTAPFRCTYCDKHYNHRQSLWRHLKKLHQEVPGNSSPSENFGAIPACITRAEACRLLTRIFTTCVLPMAAEVR